MKKPLLAKIPWFAMFSDKEVDHARVCFQQMTNTSEIPQTHM